MGMLGPHIPKHFHVLGYPKRHSGPGAPLSCLACDPVHRGSTDANCLDRGSAKPVGREFLDGAA
jgi:hypothetical protein